MQCFFCNQDNDARVLVCRSCGRDITIPVALIAERDDLIKKRDEAREELASVTGELESTKLARKRLGKGRD